MADGFSLQRRRFICDATATAGAAALIRGDPAGAACLPGDKSPDCIGVYKLPYLDARESEWLNNKESLELFAPDIRFVEREEMPATLVKAKEELRAQRKRMKSIRDVVLEGDLKEAGIVILDVIPKVTGAGMRIQQHVEARAVPGDKEGEGGLTDLNGSLEELLAQWNSVDIEIGQALRGQRGVTTVAQIEILADLKEVKVAFDDFIRLVELNTMK